MLDQIDKKIDDVFSQRTTRFTSRTGDLVDELRVFPWPLPATHVFEYRWEETATAANPRSLPVLITGCRELTINEIADRTKNFETLDLPSLVWLQKRHNIQPLSAPLVKGEKLDDATALRRACQAFVKTYKPPVTAPAVIAEQPAPAGDAVTLPDDIAKMDGPAMETEAALLEIYDEFKRFCPGKSNIVRRQWLATKRAEINAAKVEPAGV